MFYITYITVFALGAIIGSFLNVVILRSGTGIGFLRGSFCFTCRAALRFYEMVPIFSFLAQKGRCRSCRAKIHFQYPLVETLAGILFVGVWLREMGGATLLDVVLRIGAYENILPRLVVLWAIVSVLLVIAAYDIRHKIIKDSFVYTFIVLAFAPALSNLGFENWDFSAGGGFGNWEHLLSHLTAGLVFFLLFAAVWFLSRGKWMGFGDAKLAAGVGVFFGFSMGTAALILSFWIGAIVSILLLFAKQHKKLFSGLKNLTIKSEIPFAPFLVFGFFVVYLLQIDFGDIAQIFIVSSI
ncbi:MAG: prepilin peptidase [Parcubacteria group bacterium]|nr:prepilin peptidase [Parcubacteria group bacterium]